MAEPAELPNEWVTREELEQVEATRRGMLREARSYRREEVASVHDLEAAGVAARLIRPERDHGLIVFFHGGGFVFGERDTHEAVGRRLANRTGYAVLVVDYRRAPEAPFPAAVEDTLAVCGWLAAQDDFGPLVVAGDSAGGALALLAAVRHPELWSAQVLIYPYLDPRMESYDHEIEADFSVVESARFWRLYLQGADPTQVDADPLRADSFAGLPRTLLQVAELDILRPTSQLLAERLRSDGVEVELELITGVGHGFWRREEYPESDLALSSIGRFLAG